MNEEVMRLLEELRHTGQPQTRARLRIMADVLAEVGLLANTPDAQYALSGETQAT